MPGRRKPNAAQISSKVPAPNTQRQNTTSSTGCPETSTNQPMVPDISMAAVISNEPRRIVLSIINLLFEAKVCQSPAWRLQRKKQAKLGSAFFIEAVLINCLTSFRHD